MSRTLVYASALTAALALPSVAGAQEEVQHGITPLVLQWEAAD